MLHAATIAVNAGADVNSLAGIQLSLAHGNVTIVADLQTNEVGRKISLRRSVFPEEQPLRSQNNVPETVWNCRSSVAKFYACVRRRLDTQRLSRNGLIAGKYVRTNQVRIPPIGKVCIQGERQRTAVASTYNAV